MPQKIINFIFYYSYYLLITLILAVWGNKTYTHYFLLYAQYDYFYQLFTNTHLSIEVC